MDEVSEGKVSSSDEIHVIKPRRRGLMLEVLMFTFFLGKIFSDTIIVNVIERNACLVVLGMPEGNCTGPVSSGIKNKVQQNTENILMARIGIECLGPAVLSLFLGPWSDTNGRLPLLIMSVSGSIVSSCMWCVMSVVPGLHPAYFLLASIPVVLGGSYASFFLALYCYISDTTEKDERAFRLLLIDAFSTAGCLLSMLVTPKILAYFVKFGYTIIFGLSTALLTIVLLIACCSIKESVNVVERRRTKLWNTAHVREIFSTTLSFRPNNIRTIIICIICSQSLSLLIFTGESANIYLFTQKRFDWTLVEYTRLTSYILCVSGLTIISSNWLLISLLKLPELPVMLVGTLCRLVSDGIYSVASSGIHLYIAGTVNTFSSLLGSLARSQMSKLIPSEDLGKVFAFNTFIESCSPLVSSPLYGFVYKATVDTSPNAIFWLSSWLSTICVFLIGAALVLHRRGPFDDQRGILVNEEDDSSSVQA